MQGAFDAHDLVGAVLAIDHCDRAEEALAADVLFAQVAEADARLADMPPLGVMDPGTHGVFAPCLRVDSSADASSACGQQAWSADTGVAAQMDHNQPATVENLHRRRLVMRASTCSRSNRTQPNNAWWSRCGSNVLLDSAANRQICRAPTAAPAERADRSPHRACVGWCPSHASAGHSADRPVRKCCLDLPSSAVGPHLFDQIRPAIKLRPVDPSCRGNQVAMSVQLDISQFKDTQVRPGLRADAQHFLKDATGRHVRQSLSKDQRHRGGGSGNTGVTVDEEVRVRLRLFQQFAAKAEKSPRRVPAEAQ